MKLSPLKLLKRDLGTVGAYATMVGMLVGAGIFRVTTDAWQASGASLILGYLVLSPVILATSVSYAAFASTSLGSKPGGEYTHFSETFGNHKLAFCGVWLKIVSYLGAQAFLCIVFADYLMPVLGIGDDAEQWRIAIALGIMTFFLVIHIFGVKWFGRIQVALCAILGVSVAVLVIPGLFAIESQNYRPFFTHGLKGFLASLPLLFFAYAGFESVTHAAGEVADSSRQLPKVFLRGILITTVVFVSMSVVTFGVLPGATLATSGAPMADVAEQYLPRSISWIISLGALAAVATSINSIMLVPARLGMMLAADGLAPAWAGKISERSRVPFVGLLVGYGLAALLIVAGHVKLALGIAILSLTILYAIHSATLLMLPRRRPDLYAEATRVLSGRIFSWSAWLSLVSLSILVAVQVWGDVESAMQSSLSTRFADGALSGTELVLGWSLIGALLFRLNSRRT